MMSMKVAKWQSQAFASADCRRLSSSRIWPPVSRFSRPSPTFMIKYRVADHIAEGYEKRGVPEQEAERRAKN
jgi:hypothetical protein